MATIKRYKTSSGASRYEIFVSVGYDELTGKLRRIHKRGFKDKKEATLAASRYALDADAGSLPSNTHKTFKAVYLEWDAVYKNTVRESTYERTFTQIRNHILPLFGSLEVKKITASQLQHAVNQWATEATKNYRRWLTTASRILEFAVQRGYIAKNPAKLVVIPKAKEPVGDTAPNFWDKQELTRFFSYIDPDKEPAKNALFRVLAFGGLRRGECLALTWQDISFTDSTITINKTLTQGMKGRQIVQAPKTRKSRRTIAMDGKTMAVLKHWRVVQLQKYMALGFNTNKPDQLVFPNTKNQHMLLHKPADWLKSIEDAHKIQHRITVHGFRHSHASALFSGGATVKEVQERLGHEDVKTTLNIYTHVTQSQNEEAVKKLAAYLNF
ncbi:tyrosine-type recombinase/integrase [Lacticaseibacillus rhamnosus]|uniref:tyrosine-type recombinase/integrase n=1 Tax=Lacticaseibacillus rhamnosus TaxID=47715 RepID=UPI00237EFE7B|nr:tyrosine-type recombinase/integrase [Lacticaseibacillus rhamnosus]MDE3295706.1 site-specific integrase [Lacticaseibacillus rhamnosus]